MPSSPSSPSSFSFDKLPGHPHIAYVGDTLQVEQARLADLAAKALAPKQANVLSLAHLHAPLVSVREQAMVVVDRLRQQRAMTFRALTHDSSTMLTTVARFLALLELFRDGAVAFEQLTPLGELTIRWTGADDAEWAISNEFDETQDTTEMDQ